MSAPPVEVVSALALYLPEDRVDDACQLLRADSLPKLEMFAREIRSIVDHAYTKPLADQKEYANAAEMVSRGVIALKELDALRRTHTDPLNAEVKAINGLFAVLTDQVEALVGPLKRDRSTPPGKLEKLILAFRAEEKARVEREAREAQRLVDEAAERERKAQAKLDAAKNEQQRKRAAAEVEAASKAQTAALVAAPTPVTRGIRTDSGLVSERERYVLEGFTDMDQVPPSYWRHPRVIEALKSVLQEAIDKGERQIPGCVIGLIESLRRGR